MSFSRLPNGSSDLTATPWDDFDSDDRWVDVAQLDIKAPVSAFWHCMATWTNARHFNRNIWRVDIIEDAWCSVEGKPQPAPLISEEAPKRPRVRGSDAPPAGTRWVGLRELQRKTPAPVGGGEDGLEESQSVLEWAVHYISAASGRHIAIFGMVIPETARRNGNHRALQYWPFQYPKTRALAVSYEPLTGLDDVEDSDSAPLGKLRYSVLPLEPDSASEARSYDSIKKYAENAALKLLHTVRKYCDKFDPVMGVSTYVKRVVHDRFVDEESYRNHFARLKKRYGLHWCKVWHEHAETDPVKFVYEEMSIAAYLIALFELEKPEKKQTFVDLGCGNGFLTYLLLEEGYSGTGIDIFSRDLWDAYPSHVRERLKKEKIDPESYVAPDDVDWIVGNHSDELTPWIPAIAARSQRGRETGVGKVRPQFFVLPCCFFDMDGRKYAQNFRRTFNVKDQGQGRYEMYITYVERLARGFGFSVERENMRIPSTKYIALLGQTIEFPERATDQAVASTCRLAMDDARMSHMKA